MNAPGEEVPAGPYQRFAEEGAYPSPTRCFGPILAFTRREHQAEFRKKIYVMYTALHIFILTSNLI